MKNKKKKIVQRRSLDRTELFKNKIRKEDPLQFYLNEDLKKKIPNPKERQKYIAELIKYFETAQCSEITEENAAPELGHPWIK